MYQYVNISILLLHNIVSSKKRINLFSLCFENIRETLNIWRNSKHMRNTKRMRNTKHMEKH